MSWLTFGDPHPSKTGKTLVWPIRAKTGGWLGEVRWFGRWRRYSFFPAPGTVYEKDCLRDIADFCERQTRDRKVVST